MDTTTSTLSTAQRKRLLRAAIFTPLGRGRFGLPLLLWGPVGAAKTSIVLEIAAECGMPAKILSPGRSGDGAFGVTPVPAQRPTGDGGQRLVISYPAPEWVETFDAGRGLLFCDEINSAADDAIQAAMLGLLDPSAREVGGATLPGGVRTLGAANDTDVAAGGRELAFPVLNRTGHLPWPAPTVEEHAAYMMREETGSGAGVAQVVDPDAEEARVMAAWPDAWAVARALETAFLSRRPALKNVTFKPGMRACATDRTWEMAARAYASSIVHGLDEDETGEFLACFVGAAPATEFLTFVAEQDLPDPAKLLDGAAEWRHDPARIDRTAAVLGACAALVVPPNAKNREKRAERLWALIESMVCGPHGADKDIVVPAVTMLVAAKLNAIGAGPRVLAVVLATLRAAGIAQ